MHFARSETRAASVRSCAGSGPSGAGPTLAVHDAWNRGVRRRVPRRARARHLHPPAPLDRLPRPRQLQRVARAVGDGGGVERSRRADDRLPPRARRRDDAGDGRDCWSAATRSAPHVVAPGQVPILGDPAGVAELADAAGLGPVGPRGPWRFESSRPHLGVWLQPDPVRSKRPRRRNPMSCRVAPSSARSARFPPSEVIQRRAPHAADPDDDHVVALSFAQDRNLLAQIPIARTSLKASASRPRWSSRLTLAQAG